jgi:hypothetical protein
MAIIGITLIIISVLYEFTSTFYDLGSSINFSNQHNESFTVYVVPSILQAVLLIAFTSVVAFSGMHKKPLKI